ncbi:MAG: DUF1593 domain-containing protein [Synoicihabitans sp.]
MVISPATAAERPRVIVLADMGNEPDEEQQMVHLLMYANELDIEGLIAVTGKYLRKDPQPELFFHLIDGYDRIVENLRLHAEGWPDASQLNAVVSTGQHRYGIADTGPGKSTPGSRALEAAMRRDDPRPLHVIVNAGSNTLAQALLDLEARLSADEFAHARAQLRVFENGAQDNSGAWIVHRWPDIHWIRSNYQTYAYGGPSIDGGRNNGGQRNNLGPYTWAPYEYSGLGQHQWALKHLKGNHGPLMARWPIRQFGRGGVSFLEGGGTIPFLRLLPNGLNNPAEPTWGGWGGRYGDTRTKNVWSKHRDVRVDEETYGDFQMFDELSDTWTDPESGIVYEDHNFAPVWRWRDAFFRDFAARADWCTQTFSAANHAPQVYVQSNGNRDSISYTALVKDPDGDSVTTRWWVYPEPSTYSGDLESVLRIDNEHSVTVFHDALGDHTLHLILEVTDQPAEDLHPMTSYLRIVASKPSP